MHLPAYTALVTLAYAVVAILAPAVAVPLVALFVPALVVPACWKRFHHPRPKR